MDLLKIAAGKYRLEEETIQSWIRTVIQMNQSGNDAAPLSRHWRIAIVDNALFPRPRFDDCEFFIHPRVQFVRARIRHTWQKMRCVEISGFEIISRLVIFFFQFSTKLWTNVTRFIMTLSKKETMHEKLLLESKNLCRTFSRHRNDTYYVTNTGTSFWCKKSNQEISRLFVISFTADRNPEYPIRAKEAKNRIHDPINIQLESFL